MRTEIIRDWRRFEELEREWNSLLTSSRADTIFLRWEWIRSWGKVLGDDVRPFVVVVRDEGGTLAGVAPFYKTFYRLLRVLPYKVLRIMGDFPTGAECLDWILRSGSESEASRSIAAALSDAAGEWDFLWMPYVPHWTGGRDWIRDASVNQGFHFSEREVLFGDMPLPGSLDELISSFSSNHRNNSRRYLKRTFDKSTVRFIHCRKEEEIPRFLDALFSLHALRWGLVGEPGAFRKKPNEARFYREFAMQAQRQNWLGLYGIEISGELKSVQYGYMYNGVFLQMQEGFDRESGRGLGNILRLKVIEDLIAKGIKIYDFLGEMSEHKKSWHTRERTGSHLMIGNGKYKNRVLFKNNIWPTGRYLTHAEAKRYGGKEKDN
jgi:CelD/BcsL family acetyltransferase involved in cellulose biosynthesis